MDAPLRGADTGVRPSTTSTAVVDDNRQAERDHMVDRQLVARGLTSASTLAAMRKVPRHRFVPEHLRGSAYADRPLPIGDGQTISQPYIVAYMTDIAGVTREARVLEVGTGSGYEAAVAAELSDHVYSIEIIPAVAARAAKTLKENGYGRVHLRVGDGHNGWPEHAPFDVILVTAAAEHVPPPLVAHLKEGGRMVIPVGPRLGDQNLLLVTKQGGRVNTATLMPVLFVPLVSRKP